MIDLDHKVLVSLLLDNFGITQLELDKFTEDDDDKPDVGDFDDSLMDDFDNTFVEDDLDNVINLTGLDVEDSLNPFWSSACLGS